MFWRRSNSCWRGLSRHISRRRQRVSLSLGWLPFFVNLLKRPTLREKRTRPHLGRFACVLGLLRAKIDEPTADSTAILRRLRTMHFEERFRYDENGVPRVWKPDDDIEGAFRKAKDVPVCSRLCGLGTLANGYVSTRSLLPLFSKISLVDPLPSPTNGTEEECLSCHLLRI